MEKIIWNEESWSVGHSLMDDQHQQILALINKMIEIRQGKRPKSDLLTALSLLSQQITHHFGAEGVVLLSVKMPNLEEHIKSHEQFSSKLREFLLDCNGLSSEQTIDSLALTQIDPPSAHEVDPPLFMLRIIDPGRQYSQANNEQ